MNITYGERVIPCRPNQYDEEVIRYSLDKIRPALESYFDGDFDDEMYNQALRAIQREGQSDAYRIVKRLDDNYGWECTSELIEIFDGLPYYFHLKKLEQEWVKSNGIEPLCKIGDNILFRTHSVPKHGVIEEIIDTGHYAVSTEGFEGRYIVAWENVLELP